MQDHFQGRSIIYILFAFCIIYINEILLPPANEISGRQCFHRGVSVILSMAEWGGGLPSHNGRPRRQTLRYEQTTGGEHPSGMDTYLIMKIQIVLCDHF